jgi:hypothetical protein
MTRGRPRKPLAYHLLTGGYRPSRHGPLPGQPTAEEKQQAKELDEHAKKFAAELEQWAMLFRTGYDHFRHLAGIAVEPSLVWPPKNRPAAEKTFRRQCADAWKRLGPLFMQTWQADEVRAHPWAWEKWGDPRKPLKTPKRLWP